MGDVYEAWDIVLARPVALKILQHLEPAAMIRFMHEAQLHARLDSPNICRIYDVDASGGTPRIAMQLIRGPTLEEAAQDLRLDEVVGILAQVAEAVHGAHQFNLIHRDIKPSNILLQWNEQRGWTPYICDFGLAMALDGPSVTQPLAMTGTPAYMAPEQVRGDRSLVGPPTDVYGIGSTLYFTLLGRPPCVATVTAEMLKVKRERRFPSPRELEPTIPPALEAIMYKCLEPSPQDRYATPAELARELRGVLAALTGQPEPQGLKGRALAWTHDRRRVLAVLTAAVCLVGTLPILASYLKRQGMKEGEVAQIIALEASSLEQSIRCARPTAAPGSAWMPCGPRPPRSDRGPLVPWPTPWAARTSSCRTCPGPRPTWSGPGPRISTPRTRPFCWPGSRSSTTGPCAPRQPSWARRRRWSRPGPP